MDGFMLRRIRRLRSERLRHNFEMATYLDPQHEHPF